MSKACRKIDLSVYTVGEFRRGASAIVETLWLVVQALFISSWLPGSFYRRFLLRLFGAQIGVGVSIKPGVRVKFPWRLCIGEHSWIGEDVWIDNLADVNIGSNCCISQGVYLCTGSHDWRSSTFCLIIKPIVIEDQVWIAARATVRGGVRAGEGSLLTLGSVAVGDLAPWTVYQGNPAEVISTRVLDHG